VRDLAVRSFLVVLGVRLAELAARRAEVGLAGPGEVATAQLFVSEQRSAALAGQEALDAASDALASLIGRRPDGVRYRAITPPPAEFPVDGEDVVLARALEANDELRAARADVAAAEARARAAGWDRLPQLDLVGSLGGNGLAGDPQPVSFLDTTLVVDESGGFSESVSEAVGRDYPTWSVGMTLEIPLLFREGRGERERLVGEVDRARARLEAVQRSLADRVRARHRELVNGRERLELARAGLDAALEQGRIGRIEYENGRITALDVARIGADVASAEQRHADALVRTARAAAELARLAPEGPTLEEGE
jgi:outer membrane protein TolC